MAASWPPIKNNQNIFHIALKDLSTPGSFKSSPTLAAGDFKVDIDGAGLNNLGTLPTVDPGSSIWVKVTLSTSEMNGDSIQFQAIDQTATKEWGDHAICIQTCNANLAVDVQTIKTQAVTASAAVTVNANVGTTQPINFTGTGGTAYVKGDTINWAGAATATDDVALATSPTNFASLSISAAGIVSTQQVFYKNRAYSNFAFLMTDSSTHKPKTGLTVTVTISKDGGGFAASTNSASELASGWYLINLAAADLNADSVILRMVSSGADDQGAFIATQST